MDETNIELKLNDHEHEIGSLKHRLDNVEKRQDALDKLAESTGRMDTAAIVLTDKQAEKSCFSTCRMSWWGIISQQSKVAEKERINGRFGKHYGAML